MLKKLSNKASELGMSFIWKLHQFKNDERGELSTMVWIIGSAVIVVLVIVVFMTLVPDTAENMWDSFVSYAKRSFGL